MSRLINWLASLISKKSDLSPNSVRLEACSICQLRCPLCPTGKGINKIGPVGWGYLKFRDFKKFVDGNPQIHKIELSNWGEIFLNPQLGRIIKYAYERKISLTADNGVNLNSATDSVLESLVKYQFKSLTVSLDGASSRTYQFYRRGGNFNRVLQNIKKINSFKEKYQSIYPKLTWQFIIMGHNEKELPQARQMAERLKMNFRCKLNWNSSFSPIVDVEYVKKESGLGVISREEFRQKKEREYLLACSQFWLSPQINWDGKLLGCCINQWGDFGNVFKKGFKNCLESQRYIYAKEMLLGKRVARDDIPCSRCPTYQKILESPLKKEDLFKK